MYVEDLLLKIRDELLFSSNRRDRKRPTAFLCDEWHRNFVVNVSEYVAKDKSLSTKQGSILLKFIDSKREQIVQCGLATDQEIGTLVSSPTYRRPLYESSNVPREVRYLGDNLLAFRFKKDDSTKDRIKNLGGALKTNWLDGGVPYPDVTTQVGRYQNRVDKIVVDIKPRFDWIYKVWIVPVYRFNLNDIISLISSARFGMDGITLDYINLAKQSFNRSSVFDVDPHDEVILANVCDNPILGGWMTEIAGGIKL